MIDPRGLTVKDWTDSMSFLLTSTGVSIMTLLDEENWREWARNVIQDEAISGSNPPDPNQFEDWREWAIRFNYTVNLAG